MDEAIAATVQEFPSDAPNAAEPKGGSSESEHELERVSACEAPSQGVCRESAEMGDTKEETPLATTAVLPIVPLEIAAAQKRLPEHATTALFLACATGKVDPVRELIDAGLDVNCTDYDRRTPLHVAASEGHKELALYLIKQGANVNTADRWGATPLQDACRCKHDEVAALLTSYGAVLAWRPNDTAALLCSAATRGDLDTLRRLVAHGADVNVTDYDNRTALHVASCDGHLEVVKFLVKNGANINARDRYTSTPLHGALRSGHLAVAAYLRSLGAESRGALGPETGGWEIDPATVELGDVIGEGSFGQVYVARWRGLKVAAKTLRTDKIQPCAQRDFTNEVLLLSRLRHPNLVLFLGACLNKEPRMVIQEFLGGGTLEDLLQPLRAKRKTLPLARVVCYAREIALGMNYLHHHQPCIIHRDLKPCNLLFDERGHLKVADFGLGRIVQRDEADQVYKLTGGTGSYRYMAPEVARHEAYSEKVDVYSYAMVLWFMRTSLRPFEGMHPILACRKVATEHLRPDITRISPPQLAELLRVAWDPNPRLRPSFDEVLEQLDRIPAHTSCCVTQ